jgi:NADPH:quinone reductase
MLPTKMKAVLVTEPGGSDKLKIAEIDCPTPARGEVLIRVAAAGVNRPDVLQRLGLYPPPAGASPRLGLEVSGEVVATGGGIGASLQGKKVMALVNGGGYSEYVVAPAGQCMRVPSGLSMVEAASLPETYLTVWQNLFMKGGLQAGHHVLIHGGSSGIGCAAIQLAKMHGAWVHVTVGDQAAGDQSKVDFCKKLGADFVYLYKQEDWAQAVLNNTGGQGAEVILDMVAGEYVDKNLSCAKSGAKVIVIALLGGRFVTLDAAKLMTKQIVLTGTTLRPQSSEFKAQLSRVVENVLEKGFSSGQLRSVVQAQFDLDRVAAAHDLMESGRGMGKIVLNVGE